MADGTELAAVTERVRERIDPAPDERDALQEAVRELIAATESALDDIDVEGEVIHVGSTARGTWVSGDRDIDIFVSFPESLPREDLERLGLQVGNAVLPEGQEEYAEHPYVSGEFDGFAVDLVPCYDVDSPRAIRSSVDRTPFHNAYLEERIDDETAGDVRLLKQFLSGIGIYGSDLRTRGFSGYLVELLVLEYGTFEAVLEAVAEWHPPVRLDPEGHGEKEFDDSLVFIDPTDPARNVAAVVSETSVARFVHHARELLEDPTVSRFFPEPPNPLSADAVVEHVERRGTTPIAVLFEPPDVVDDQLYPQLRRSLDGLTRGLEHRGFSVLRAATWAEERAVLLVELERATLPDVERHEGPPVYVSEHAENFTREYADTDVYGPFIDGDRYVVEREREVADAVTFVAEKLHEVALGAQVEDALRDGYTVYSGAEIGALAEEFGRDLADYFDPAP
ncbi:MAG: CCA tRNA nucleotidyltransferase [Halodesulfurarchaeum sp.]